MLRNRGCGIYLLVLLWISFPTPPTSGQLLTEAEIDSMIPSDSSYAGSEVRALVKGIVTAARTEIRAAAAEAVKEAVVPLAAELAGEKVRADRWETAWREEFASRTIGRLLLLGGAAMFLFAGGAAFGVAVF